MENKIGMHIRMPIWLDDAVRDKAWELRMSPQELIRQTLAASLEGRQAQDANA